MCEKKTYHDQEHPPSLFYNSTMSEESYLSFLTGLVNPGSQHYLHHKLHSDIAAAAMNNNTEWDAREGDVLMAESHYTLQVCCTCSGGRPRVGG